jgi:hypothetical protein
VNKLIKLEVFGKQVLAMRTNEGWSMFYLSDDGKKRPAYDILVPDFVNESEIENFLADICHEWATERNNSVRRLK